MERSGIETLLEAAALDAANFLQPQTASSTVPAYQRDLVYNQAERFLPPPNQPNTRPIFPNYAEPPSYTLKTQSNCEQLISSTFKFSTSNSAVTPSISSDHKLAIPNISTHSDDTIIGSESSQTQEIWDHCAACTPLTAPQGQLDWIECSICQKWFHYYCVGLTPKTAKHLDDFHCPECTKTHGPSTFLRKSKRKHAPVDYVALHQGEVLNTDEHAHSQIVQTRTFSAESFKRLNGSELTAKLASSGGVSEPVVIPKTQRGDLGLRIPSDLTVREVGNLVGMDSKVEVIDVPTQHESPHWDLQRWVDYYEQPSDARDRVLNVISLEVSMTKLGDQIERPRFVRDLDLVEKYWPDELTAKGLWPKVSLYCLMSVEGAYTDFHIDFGGSSVFYHVIRGCKEFLFIRPTPYNLSKYEAWCSSSDQSKIFFGDWIKDCYKIRLEEGDTMIIPSGWIHAVFTPSDSLVIGGNFLTLRDMSMQLTVSKIEKTTKVPQKFRFPHFTKLLWHTAHTVMNDPAYNMSEPQMDSGTEASLIALAEYLFDQVNVINGSKSSATALDIKHAKSSLMEPIKEATIFTKVFGKWVYSLSGRSAPSWTKLNEDEESFASAENVSKSRKRRRSSVESEIAVPLTHVKSEGSTIEQSNMNDLFTRSANVLSVPMTTSSLKTSPVLERARSPDLSKQGAVGLVATVAAIDGHSMTTVLAKEDSHLKPVEEKLASEMSSVLSSPLSNLPSSIGISEHRSQPNHHHEEPDDFNGENHIYESDAASEASTIIRDDKETKEEGSEDQDKKFTLYEELTALYNSRTRRSKSRRSSTSAINEIDQDRPERHGKSSFIGKQSGSQATVKSTSDENSVPAIVKRGRGRPRKSLPTESSSGTGRLVPGRRAVSDEFFKSRKIRNETMKGDGTGNNDKTDDMQSLIREAQFGLRSHRRT
ncbi:uncharacterized protein V1516DRAFT_647035 [Lipomyces oligophaga]|uniref:uncharacterized protein n=1 Tax=Lipomyces oligophaga TaxID=45792 RepID=UPI0034CF6B9E